MARFHYEDHEGRRDDQHQDADDRRPNDLRPQESERDENHGSDAQEEGSMEQIEDEGNDPDEDEEAVHGGIADETEESVVQRLVESGDRRGSEAHGGQKSVQGLAAPVDQACRHSL